jgi:hypothetical protein
VRLIKRRKKKFAALPNSSFFWIGATGKSQSQSDPAYVADSNVAFFARLRTDYRHVTRRLDANEFLKVEMIWLRRDRAHFKKTANFKHLVTRSFDRTVPLPVELVRNKALAMWRSVNRKIWPTSVTPQHGVGRVTRLDNCSTHPITAAYEIAIASAAHVGCEGL